MDRNFKINPVGLKGNEINERMKQLMGVTPINEGISRSTVELTKIGPDGKTYGIVRENHEYYIKVSDKTSNLTVEDFKYIGGLQNKKSEAYPSYAKATKHLNLKFNSICESFDIVNTFNVFVDDNLLSEGAAKEAGKHITDAKGKNLEAKAKEEGGDNVADKKVMDEMEEVTLTEDELAIEAMLNEEELDEEEQGEIAIKVHNKLKKKEEEDEEDYGTNALTGEKLPKPNPITEEDMDEAEDKDNPWAICTASVGREDKEKYEACVRKVKKEKGIKEELKGNQSKIDANKNGKIDGEDFKMLRKGKTNENEMDGLPSKPTLKTAKTGGEWIEALDDASAKEILQSLYDELGAPVVKIAKKALGFIGGPDVRDALNKKDELEEEMTPKQKKFAALAEPKDKITYADKIAGATKDEAMTLEEIQEAIADLKKKL
jgi:hypothetical protein